TCGNMRRRPGRRSDARCDRLFRPKDLSVSASRVCAPCFQARSEAAQEGWWPAQVELSAGIHAEPFEQGRVQVAGRVVIAAKLILRLGPAVDHIALAAGERLQEFPRLLRERM